MFPGNVEFTKVLKGFPCFRHDLLSPFGPESLIFLKFSEVFEVNSGPLWVISAPFRAPPGPKARGGGARICRSRNLELLSKGFLLAGFFCYATLGTWE